MIKIKRESSLFNLNGFALYINGHRAHLGTFPTVAMLREYWHEFRKDFSTGNQKDIERIIFG